MKKNVQTIWINRVGMSAVVLVSFGYVLFGNAFAQLRLQFSFLDFPIFIGEILLAFSFLLFILKSRLQKKWELGYGAWILGAYLFFILFKAFYGYRIWGPLAFRDAALFYYPFFVLLGYSFWSREFLGKKIIRLFMALILSIFILRQFVAFWPCSLIILGLIFAIQTKSVKERRILIGVTLLFAPYGALFNVFYRTAFLSTLITVIYIAAISFLLFCTDKWTRIVGVALGCLVLGMISFKFIQTGVGSTFVIKDVKSLVTTTSQEPPRGKYLFHPVGSSPEKPDAIKAFSQRMSKESFSIKKNAAPQVTNETLRVKESDTLFRYYIWRDMFFEYARFKPLFGFDFGRPLCSTTMEYYGISSSEYQDGWVGAHNSFLYMIYRAGIVGIAMVLFVFALWFGLLRDFYILRDWTGILLCAILLNWFVSANFFLIFELPYTAIPIWTILGITLKHRMFLKKTLKLI